MIKKILLALLLLAPFAAYADTNCLTFTSIDSNGNSITLSSVGIARCFYISKSLGSNSNAGTSEGSPWASLPGMPSCSGNCSAHTPASGDAFILYGGDTWTSGDLGVTWNWGGSNSSNQIYVGIDQSTPWFNASVCGASWCRPIWNFTGTSGKNAFLAASNKSWWWLDNVEIKGMCNNENGVYVQGATNVRASRLYFHGWTHCTSSDNVGFFSQGGSGATADHNVIDGSDSSKNTFNGAFSYWSSFKYNFVQYVVSGFLGGADQVHDNIVLNAVTSADGDHCNGIFTFYPINGNYQLIYNNVIAMSNACSGGVNSWFNGNSGTNSTWKGWGFGNVYYNTSGGNLINFGNHGAGNYGTYYWFNNTVDGTNGGCGGTPSSGPFWSIYDENNHYIACTYAPVVPPSGGTVIGPCTNGSGASCHDIKQTLSAANGQGYNKTQTAPYSPINSCTSGTCATVQSGSNLTTAVCNTLNGVNTDAFNACNLGRGGITYNSTTHTVSQPNYTTNARPSSAGWDTGAYQFASGGGGAANAPTFSPTAGTFMSAQSVTPSTTSGGAIICYTIDGSTPITNTVAGCTHGTLFSSAIAVSVTTTIKAVAGGTGYTDSAVSTGVFTLQGATPTFSPVPGTYSSTQSVTPSATFGGTICYTTDGSTPATNGSTGCTHGTLFTTAISVSTSETIMAIAGGTGISDGSVASGAYTISSTVAAPTFTPNSTTSATALFVTVASTSPGATICYTVNGSVPTASVAGTCDGLPTQTYSGPITVATSQTINAIGTLAGSTNSTMSSASYIISTTTQRVGGILILTGKLRYP